MTDEERSLFRPLGSQANIDLALPVDSCRFTSIINTNSTPEEPITFNDSYNALVALNEGSSMLSGTKIDQLSALLKSFDFTKYLNETGLDLLDGYLDKAEWWLSQINLSDLTENPIIAGVRGFKIFSPDFNEWYHEQWYHLLGVYDQLMLFQILAYNISVTLQIYQANYPNHQFLVPDQFTHLNTKSEDLWNHARAVRAYIVNQIVAVRATYPNDPRLADWEADQALYLEITDEN